MNTYPCTELISTVCIGYSVTVSNDLSVIVIESQIFKCITLPYHTNCIGYSDLGYSDKPVIMIGRREAKRTILCKGIHQKHQIPSFVLTF